MRQWIVIISLYLAQLGHIFMLFSRFTSEVYTLSLYKPMLSKQSSRTCLILCILEIIAFCSFLRRFGVWFFTKSHAQNVLEQQNYLVKVNGLMHSLFFVIVGFESRVLVFTRSRNLVNQLQCRMSITLVTDWRN